MQKQIPLSKFIKPLFLLVLLFTSYYSFTNSGGANPGNTAAPGDGNCTSCHTGGSLITSGTNWNNFDISTNVPPSGYTPGGSYTITITHTISGINKWGFEALVLNSSNTQAGSITAGTGNQTASSGLKTYVTHTSSGNTGTGTKTWTFTWVAPNPGVGDVTIYSCVNAANGDGGTSGDQIFAKSLSVIQLTNLPSAVIDGLPSSGSACLGDTLRLTGSGINSPTSYAWTFSGLPASSSQTPDVLFTTTGTKTITLITTNSFGNSATNIKTFNVVNKPTAVLVPAGSTLNKCGTDTVTITTNVSPVFSFLWSPGNETTPSIKVVDTGSYSVKVTNPVTGCFIQTSTIHVLEQPKPVPILSISADTICSVDSLELISSAPFSSYRFFDGNTLLQSSTLSSYKKVFSGGTKNIGLLVTSAAGCKSDTIRKTAYILPKLAAPTISCGAKTTSSITFTWIAIPTAIGYEVSEDTGNTWIMPSGNLEHTIAGLNPNSNVQILVRAIDAGLCEKGNIGSQICTNGACSPIQYQIHFVPKICLTNATDSAIVNIELTNLNIANAGISFNGNSYSTNPIFNTNIGKGINSINVKIVDSANIGCPRVDTNIVVEGLFPIAKKPIVNAVSGFCSSIESVQEIEVTNANNGATYYQFFYNQDSIPFATVNDHGTSNVSTIISRAVLAFNTSDLITVNAVDSISGCSILSAPLSVLITQSPLAGYTYTHNGLTLQLNDTSAFSVKRNWLFSGAIPNAIDAPKVQSFVFPTAGNYSVILQINDSVGCTANTMQSIMLFNTGLLNLTKETSLNILPNPAQDVLNIVNAEENAMLFIIYMGN